MYPTALCSQSWNSLSPLVAKSKNCSNLTFFSPGVYATGALLVIYKSGLPYKSSPVFRLTTPFITPSRLTSPSQCSIGTPIRLSDTAFFIMLVIRVLDFACFAQLIISFAFALFKSTLLISPAITGATFLASSCSSRFSRSGFQ